MPRSMWKGAISFGMVSIPVRLFVATESHSASFRQLCAEHTSPIKYKRWCEAGDHEVAYADIKKGVEVSKSHYVVLDDSDLENLPLPTAHAIEIEEFVPGEGIQGGLYFKSAYYVEPDEMGRKPYLLLQKALKETSMLAIAKIAFRDREHLCAVQPNGGQLLLNTLHWPDEIRSTDSLEVADEDDVRVSPRELVMAKSLIESLAEERFEPSRYQDDYQAALRRVIDAKVEGTEVVEVQEEEPEGKVMDLMEALKASVEAAKKQRAQAAAQDADEEDEAPARRRQSRRKAS
ncbi:MAG: Ku protein [Candidatus Dormibacteraceae bacterium]